MSLLHLLYESGRRRHFTFISSIPERLNQISFSVLVGLSFICIGLDFVRHGPSLLLTILGAGFISLLESRIPILGWMLGGKQWLRKGLRFRLPLVGGVVVSLLVTVLAHPAQAQFFGNAETWMQTNLGNNTGDAIPLVFNVLRGLFLLYVGISLVRVINSARQDEDWQTIARTPLIIIIAVTAGDILTTLITGTGGEAPAPGPE